MLVFDKSSQSKFVRELIESRRIVISVRDKFKFFNILKTTS